MSTREIAHEPESTADVLVVGGGINGAGIARDAAGRGYSVRLVEQGDIAGATSSWSTKLIHGGLRYLEHREFALVRASLVERVKLMRIASHLVEPLRFVLPQGAGIRPAWLIRLGLLLYDHLSLARPVPGSRAIDLARDPAGEALRADLRTRGFTYYECRVDDVRLTLANLQDAAARGASIEPRTRLAGATVENGLWRLTLERHSDGSRRQVWARHVVNATGPWADRVARLLTGAPSPVGLRLVRGSHLVVRRPNALQDAYLMQQPDGRVVFIIPYEGRFALLGTTDEDHTDPDAVAVSEAETEYLLTAANRYLAEPLTHDSIVWAYAGVRPLLDDGTSDAQEVTRDYRIVTGRHQGAGVTHIFGGKLTTFRTLSQKAVDDLEKLVQPSGPGLERGWTGRTSFAGAFKDDEQRRRILDAVREALSTVRGIDGASQVAERLVRMYGCTAVSLADRIAADRHSAMKCGLFPGEIEHMVRHEWAVTAEDILFRRCKLGIGQPREAIDEVTALLQAPAVTDQETARRESSSSKARKPPDWRAHRSA